MSASTISGKGWVVIPKELREKYGLKKGNKVHFIDYGGVIALVPVSHNPLAGSRGMLKGRTSLTRALQNSRKEDAGKGK